MYMPQNIWKRNLFFACFKVIAAAGSDEKCALAVQKGAYASINYNTSNLKEELKKLTNKKGVNVVFDAVGGDIFKDALSR